MPLLEARARTLMADDGLDDARDCRPRAARLAQLRACHSAISSLSRLISATSRSIFADWHAGALYQLAIAYMPSRRRASQRLRRH